MLKRERQAYILHQVNLRNKVLSSSLSHEINVSEDTIRRDLMELSESGRVIKVHGGALSSSFNQVHYSPVATYAQLHKKTIAQKAVTLIKDGMFVLTGGGSTILEMARALPPQLKATFLSGSIPAILEYINHPSIEVIVIGNKLSKGSKITVGADAMEKVKQVRADICFLGINAIDLENGVTDNDWDIAQLKKSMIDSSQKVVCLSISEKLNSAQPIQVCGLKEIDILITELPADDPVFEPYKELGITVL